MPIDSMVAWVVALVVAGMAVPIIRSWRAGEAGPGMAGIATVFIALAAIALSALFAPLPFERAAGAVLVATGVRDQVRALDDAFIFDDVAEGTIDLAGRLGQRIQSGRDTLGERVGSLLGRPTPTTAPTAMAQRPAAEEQAVIDDTGVFERRLYPAIHSVTAIVLRAAGVVVALSGMAAASAMALAHGAMGRQRRATVRIHDLEARLQRVEERISRSDRAEDGGSP